MDYEDRIQMFEKDLTALINKYSLENESHTPDYILAKYLVMTLVCVNHAIGVRDAWYGKPKSFIDGVRGVIVDNSNKPELVK